MACCVQEEYDALRLKEADTYDTQALSHLISSYSANAGSSGDAVFDKRVRVTLQGLDKAIEWVKSKTDALSV